MIFLCGIPSEPSLSLVLQQLKDLGIPHTVFNQRCFADTAMEFEISGGKIEGWMRVEERDYRLSDVVGVYTRLMDYRQLPEFLREPDNSPLSNYCHSLHSTIMQWYEIAPGRVLNRKGEIGSNYSKPYQAQLIMEQGFSVPETLITNDPALVHRFQKEHGRVIYKSISSVRSIVQTLAEEDLDRLTKVKFCPIQFQKYIKGTDVRVHTVGNQSFAVEITANATDYRYSYLQGEEEILIPIELEDELADRCVTLSKSLGLEFAGIDLKISPDGTVNCLEVNACPAFSYYEIHTGVPIARAVARYLAGIE